MSKTISAQIVWQKDDRTLWEVAFDDGLKAKTWSKAISSVGWEGQLEQYTKQNNRGETEVFVKQPQKEFKGGGSPRDNDIIRAQWAIGQAVSVELIKNPSKADMSNVEALANEFFDMAERVKQPPETTNQLPVTQVEEGNPWNGLDPNQLQ